MPRKKVLADIVIPEFIPAADLREHLDQQAVAPESYELVRVAAPEDLGKVRSHIRCFDWESATVAIGFWY